MDDAEWDGVVGRAPEGTLFSESVYLQACGREADRFLVRKGREIKAAVCVLPTADGAACELDDLVIYGGLMFPPDLQRPAVKRRFEEFELTEFVIAQLDARYRTIEMALAPQMQDLRPFLWDHYGEADNGLKYHLDLRYTSYVDLRSLAGSGDPEQSACFAAMETVRRYSVREARRKGGSVRRGESAAGLIDFYAALMARQHERQPAVKLERMRRLVDGLIAAGRGAVYETCDKDGRVIYVTVYVWDAKRAYYLFGAGHPDANEPWQGTVGHWQAFVDLGRAGLDAVDLEGVNSPARGWFKLGLGGDLRPYFHVRKGCPRGEVIS